MSPSTRQAALHNRRKFLAITAVIVFWVTIADAADPAGGSRTLIPGRSAFVHPDTAKELMWQATWIDILQPSKPNQWTAFRRTLSLVEVPKRAITHIAADSKYWLWVNGTLVVREGGLKRGPTPTDTYYDEVELASYLHVGDNTIAVLVWHFGKEGFSHKDSGRSGLLFQMAGENTGAALLVSDATWRACVHPAFGDTEAPHPNYRLPESNIRFNAAQDLVGWTHPGFADDAWPVAVEVGRAPCAPWNRLVRRAIPQWRQSGLESYVNAAEFPTQGAGQPLKARLPYNAQVTPYLEVEAPAGLTIEMRMDNYLGGSVPNVRAEYITRDGWQEFECYGWMNGHEVHYTIPAGVKVRRLAYRESGFATDFAGTFACDDPFLNRLREKAMRTLYLSMRDTYMDCPDRERAQWWGDVVNELGEVFYAFDRGADVFTRKGVIELIAWQKPDGTLFSPVPAGNWEKELPLQMLASVGQQGFWTYAFYSGDFETMRAVYPGVKRYLEIWDVQRNGLVVARPGGWAWGDWGRNVDMTLLTNTWYFLALKGQRRLAVALDRPADLAWIDARQRALEGAFEKTFWTGSAYRAPAYKGETDDRANALAIVAGLVRPEHFSALLEVFRTQEHASPYMEKYVLEALCLMGEVEFAQNRMKRRYTKMVNDPNCTTLWEGWGIGKEGYGGGTINHAWSGGPLTIMSQYFAGIAPTKPAFETYHILPQPGALHELRAEIVTTRGNIAMALSRAERTLTLELNSPQGTTATVGLPMEAGTAFSLVRVNGQIVWESGRTPDRVEGVRAIGIVGAAPRHFQFEVAPGRWTFVADVRQTAR